MSKNIRAKKVGPNLLHELFLKVKYGLLSAESARPFVSSSSGLWYHAIASLNAFYAINEEMTKRTQNTDDDDLKYVVNAWRAANKAKIDTFFGKARQIATHSGCVQITSVQHWKIDYANDTEHPYMKAYITIEKTEIKEMEGVEFIDLCVQAMEFMRDGIISIDASYQTRGGKRYALPPDTSDGDLF